MAHKHKTPDGLGHLTSSLKPANSKPAQRYGNPDIRYTRVLPPNPSASADKNLPYSSASVSLFQSGNEPLAKIFNNAARPIR